MHSLLVRVKSRVFIRANRRVMSLLDGQYVALSRGRSMDFDDLRSYVPGDEVKDIDWKATARFGSALVRNYSANRQQELVVVVDTGRNMAALAASGEPKRDIAVLVAGVLGYLSLRHGDRVSLAIGNAESFQRFPPGGTEGELEGYLRRIDRAITLDGPLSDPERLLTSVLKSIRKKAIVVVIADDAPITPEIDEVAKHLQARHELLWVTVGDADLVSTAQTGAAAKLMYEVVDDWSLPDFVRGNAKLRAEFAAANTAREEATRESLEDLGISHVRIEAGSAVIPQLLMMLRRRAHARR